MNPRSSEGRRWRDLIRHYGSRLGPERLADEATRALLLNLVSLTLKLETHQLKPETQLHFIQQQRTLMQDLGLSEPKGEVRRATPDADLTDYLAQRERSVAP